MTSDQKDFAKEVQILEKERRYQGFFAIDHYRIRQRTHAEAWSKVLEREVIERGHAAAVLPYDPLRDRVVLLEQFRLPALLAGFSPWLIEIVAGILEPEEPAEALVRRETMEEANQTLGRLWEVGSYLMSPGGVTETVTLFVGEVEAAEVEGVFGLDEEGEDIRVFSLPADDAFSWVREGRINNAIGAIALMWLELNRARLQAAWTAG